MVGGSTGGAAENGVVVHFGAPASGPASPCPPILRAGSEIGAPRHRKKSKCTTTENGPRLKAGVSRGGKLPSPGRGCLAGEPPPRLERRGYGVFSKTVAAPAHPAARSARSWSAVAERSGDTAFACRTWCWEVENPALAPRKAAGRSASRRSPGRASRQPPVRHAPAARIFLKPLYYRSALRAGQGRDSFRQRTEWARFELGAWNLELGTWSFSPLSAASHGGPVTCVIATPRGETLISV